MSGSRETPPTINTLYADPLWVGCRSSLSWLSIAPPPDQHCGSSLSWLWILSGLSIAPPSQDQHCRSSELAADPLLISCHLRPPGSTLFADPLWVGCRSSLSWLLINPPGSTLDPLWVGFQLTPQGSTLCVDPLWVGCRSSLSWLSINPPPINTLSRSSLSWLSINPPSPPSPTNFNFLSWLSIYPPPSLPSPSSPTNFNFMSWLSIDPPLPSLPPIDFNFLIFNILINQWNPLYCSEDDPGSYIIKRPLRVTTAIHTSIYSALRWKVLYPSSYIVAVVCKRASMSQLCLLQACRGRDIRTKPPMALPIWT